MIRKIIRIDEDRCNGCGACAEACHEGAIAMVNGRAKLIRDDYCDGMGDCLPGCPAGAISFEEREAAAYDERAVLEHRKSRQGEAGTDMPAGGCPGTGLSSLRPVRPLRPGPGGHPASELRNWPVQIRLVPVRASFFEGAELLVAADCTAFACASAHQDFLRGRVTLIGCPKLDGVDYGEKLGEIFRENDIRSVTVLRMEVPCCGGLGKAAARALEHCGKSLPLRIVTVSVQGGLSGN